MRFFKFLIAALVMAGVPLLGGCGPYESPASSEAESMNFESLNLPSYEYVNGEIPVYRMVLTARGKNSSIEAFVWEISLQQLTLKDFKLFAYKDVNFTTSAFGANPISVNGRMIPDGRPDYYYGRYPIYLIDLSVDLVGTKIIVLPTGIPIYFELKAFVKVEGNQPGLGIYLEGVRLAGKTAAKKPIVFE